MFDQRCVCKILDQRLQKKLQFFSQDEKYVGWTFWRWGGANLRILFLWGTYARESRRKNIFHVFSKCWLMLPSVQKKNHHRSPWIGVFALFHCTTSMPWSQISLPRGTIFLKFLCIWTMANLQTFVLTITSTKSAPLLKIFNANVYPTFWAVTSALGPGSSARGWP